MKTLIGILVFALIAIVSSPWSYAQVATDPNFIVDNLQAGRQSVLKRRETQENSALRKEYLDLERRRTRALEKIANSQGESNCVQRPKPLCPHPQFAACAEQYGSWVCVDPK